MVGIRRYNCGGWVRPYVRPIIGLTMLNNLGIGLLNYLSIIDFNMPEEARDGTETLVYSYRLDTSYAPGIIKGTSALSHSRSLLPCVLKTRPFLLMDSIVSYRDLQRRM